MSDQSLGILASALTGGLAGATLTLIVNWIKGRWQKPQILVLFHNDEPGCRVDTNVLGGTDPILRFVRLKVKIREDQQHSAYPCVLQNSRSLRRVPDAARLKKT
jgi:hypothetical protein